MIRNLLVSILFFATACVGIAQADSIAKVVALSGSPKAGDRTLSEGSAIFEHDKISVGSGNVQILFVDGTKLVIGPGSSLVVEKFLMRGSGTAEKVSINALRGTFRFITGKSAKKAYDIKTANATIGIRGTGFDFWVKGDTGVAVHDGSVRLCNLTKSCVSLNAGCDLGIAQNNNSHELFENKKANGLTRKLPYAVDQRPLDKHFWLNIGACKQFTAFDPGNQGSSGKEPKPQRDVGGDNGGGECGEGGCPE